MIEQVAGVMRDGGVVMWPLLGLSLVALTLVLERTWFFLGTHRSGRRQRVAQLMQCLQHGQRERARELVAGDTSVYGRALGPLLGGPVNEAMASEALEAQRRRLERFLPTLSTIITAAPMLGILGTVLGIITSFDLLAQQTAGTDPRSVGAGIAEALITTATGLFLAVGLLFPYNAFRAQVDRTLSRLETLAAAALHMREKEAPRPGVAFESASEA